MRIEKNSSIGCVRPRENGGVRSSVDVGIWSVATCRENASTYLRLFDIENQKEVCHARADSRKPGAICRRHVRRVSSLHSQRSSAGFISAMVAPQTVTFIRIFGSLGIFPVHVKGHHCGGGTSLGGQNDEGGTGY